MDNFKFKTLFADSIFRQKYAQGVNDTWPNLCRRLVNDVCGDRSLCAKPNESPLMSKDDQDQLVKYMIDMKFVAGGRYLYYSGRPMSFYNNCFVGSTQFMTDKGLVSFKEVVGTTVNVLSPKTGQYTPAKVKSYGFQETYDITFSLVKGHQHPIQKVTATKNHRWLLVDGAITENLKIGDIVAASNPKDDYNNQAFIHGLVFADGNTHYLKSHFGHQLRLCGTKNRFVEMFDESQVSYPDFANGDACIYIKSYTNLKDLPEVEDASYIASFIKGWVAADGHASKVLHSTNKQAINWFIKNACYAGYIITSDLKCETKPSNFGERKPLYYVRFQSADSFIGFKVKSIVPTNYTETVYCVEEPVHTTFTLANGLATGNCFCLRAEEDTREEWGNIVKRASDCLMSGGGIGVDYSRLRPSGRTLSRTGGISSGPLPLMSSVNEIGRNVMQGGSRRSAIYASLNWQHEDIEAFLTAKDWSDTIKKLKAEDFNFPAYFDMTNMSINWDTAFIKKADPKLGNCAPDLWYKSVLKMCQTGEPGHSYNFFSNENDTLRNACTEFTSEDDSDVCNLGSINFGNISSLDELKSVVNLASKFLVCGSIRGDLPYDKVKQVREQNRKIGLGLMGVHEWLLQRGLPYEVNDELKSWLQVWKDESERAANEWSDRFFINRPKKYRAIAPAGTIGILASTTGGIEPLFAVAYKRRYLEGGTKWKYQYVVDSTAQHLVDTYGINPDEIETSSSLAADPERRIRFQYEIQKYVDMAISSTINLPEWGSDLNNENTANNLAGTLLKYCHGLRGITVYPNGSRGGQPLTSVSYEEAKKHHGIVYAEENTCSNGICGL